MHYNSAQSTCTCSCFPYWPPAIVEIIIIITAAIMAMDHVQDSMKQILCKGSHIKVSHAGQEELKVDKGLKVIHRGKRHAIGPQE